MRQMASPNPIPCAFVVKNASNMPSNCFGINSRSLSLQLRRQLHRDHEAQFSPATPGFDPCGVHCFECVVDQIKDDLLQLIPMALTSGTPDISSVRVVTS